MRPSGLMAYLLHQAKLQGSNSFMIPYGRQGLADDLEVERSSLSSEKKYFALL